MWDFVGVVVGILLYIGTGKEELFWPMVIVSAIFVVIMLFVSPPEGIMAAGVGAVMVFLTRIIPGFADDIIIITIGTLIPTWRTLGNLLVGIGMGVLVALLVVLIIVGV